MKKTMNRFSISLFLLIPFFLMAACQTEETNRKAPVQMKVMEHVDIKQRVDQYAPVRLGADLSALSDKQRQMLPLLIEASDIMDNLFWYQAYGEKDSLLATAEGPVRRYLEINYGPWDRLEGDKPFLANYGEKPLGTNFYPQDMTKEEFEDAQLTDKTSQYTFIRRNEAGELEAIWYHKMFEEEVKRAAGLLRQAAGLAEDAGLKKYLTARATAIETDEYYESDAAWMEMKDNLIDVVIGPIETYEDRLFGYKTGYESYILVKDREWSARLDYYAQFLPWLQEELPVGKEYKVALPGTESQLNAYDVIYYAGHSNAGSKTIAINLPNDERIQAKYGSRRLQLKNAMRAKFDQILVPLSEELIVEGQRKHITFDAFFGNTMFHEVAHGLGVKNVVGDTVTVRNALKEYASAIEEGKADVLGVFMITKLHGRGELGEADLMDYYTTFLAGIFRSIRFGASSAHGKANMVRFNYFQDLGAFSRNEDGQYRVNQEKFKEAINVLSNEILTIQGDGNYQDAGEMLNVKGQISEELQADLDRLSDAGIPVDVIFEQGVDVLGLQ